MNPRDFSYATYTTEQNRAREVINRGKMGGLDTHEKATGQVIKVNMKIKLWEGSKTVIREKNTFQDERRGAEKNI